MGEDVQLYAVPLGWAALLSWHSVVPGWWSSRPQRCKDACGGSESCGEDCIRLCVLVHTGCTRQNRFSVTPTARPTGFVVDVEDQDFRGHRRARARVFGDRQMCGEWRGRGKQSVITASTLHLYWTWQMFVAGLSVGSAPVLFIGRGGHGRIRRQPDLTWVCWWRQVTEGEVHLCRAAAAGHNFFFFRRCGGRQHRGGGARGWHRADNFRGDARRRDVSARIRAARPSHYLWPTGCSGRERGVR